MLFLQSLTVLLVSLGFILYAAHFAIRFASRIASSLGIANYIVGFIVVAVVSILPETFVAVTSAREGVPGFGLATLFGSNVADLTFVIAVILFASGRMIRVESRVLKNNELYIACLLLPILVGLDGRYTRFDGALLLTAGVLFHVWLYRKHRLVGTPQLTKNVDTSLARDLFLLLLCVGAILLGSHFVVESGTSLATVLGVRASLIGLLVVGLGTTLPELVFSLIALKQRRDSLALGDILGTVITDATAVVGVVALITPFSFNQKIVTVTGMFMVMAGLVLFYFMRSGKHVSRKEAFALIALYVLFVTVEVIASRL